METPIQTGLLTALERLSEEQFLRSVIAENIPYSGIERFVHRCLLGAFNTLPSSAVVASPDKHLPTGPAQQDRKDVDLVIFEKKNAEAWWRMWESTNDAERPSGLLRLSVALVEIKPTEFTGFLSYPPKRAALKIDEDLIEIRKAAAYARELESHSTPKELYAVLLIEACNPLNACIKDSTQIDGEAEVERCEIEFWRHVKTITKENTIGERWLLHAEPFPSDPRRKVFLKARLIAGGMPD